MIDCRTSGRIVSADAGANGDPNKTNEQTQINQFSDRTQNGHHYFKLNFEFNTSLVM